MHIMSQPKNAARILAVALIAALICAGQLLKPGGGSSSGTVGLTVTSDVWANRPGSPAAGDVFIQTDSQFTCTYTGSAWDCAAYGFHGTACADAGITWEWLNQGTSTITEDGECYLTGQTAATDDNRLRMVDVSGDWRLEALLVPNIVNYSAGGISYGLYGVDYNAGTPLSSSLTFCGFAGNANDAAATFTSRKWTDVDSFSADYGAEVSSVQALRGPNPRWIAIGVSGGNRTCEYSADGYKWIVRHSVGSTDFHTVDKVGFGALPSAGGIPVSAVIVRFTP
jgi:hypothetical protein